MAWSVGIHRPEGGRQSSGSDTVHPIGQGMSTLALDHVSVNGGTQDCWAVESILDALLGLIHL